MELRRLVPPGGRAVLCLELRAAATWVGDCLGAWSDLKFRRRGYAGGLVGPAGCAGVALAIGGFSGMACTVVAGVFGSLADPLACSVRAHPNRELQRPPGDSEETIAPYR